MQSCTNAAKLAELSLDDIESLQDQILAQLDDLNARIELLLSAEGAASTGLAPAQPAPRVPKAVD